VTTRIKGADTNAVDMGTSRAVDPVRRTAPTAHTTSAATSSGESISITATARHLISLQQIIAGTPEIDAARVTQLSQAIGQGKYTVDSAKIADRVLQLEQDLAAAKPRRQS